MNLIYAFLIGGLICLIGQLLMDLLHLLPIHITTLFVLVGAIMEPFGLYDRLIDFAGAGALLPISSFGHSMTHGALENATTYLKVLEGILSTTSVGISVAVVVALICSLIFKPKG